MLMNIVFGLRSYTECYYTSLSRVCWLQLMKVSSFIHWHSRYQMDWMDLAVIRSTINSTGIQISTLKTTSYMLVNFCHLSYENTLLSIEIRSYTYSVPVGSRSFALALIVSELWSLIELYGYHGNWGICETYLWITWYSFWNKWRNT